MSKIIQNKSEGFGYSYASLADIAGQGIVIPQMRVLPIDGVDYLEYTIDGENWHLGARVVDPQTKGQNPAQAYASALTYARRVTTQMALGLACTDDKSVEIGTQKKQTKRNADQTEAIARRKAEIQIASKSPVKVQNDILMDIDMEEVPF